MPRSHSLLTAVVVVAGLAHFPGLLAQAPDAASARVVPVQVTGDDAHRFRLVVLADGYTAADMPQFRKDLDKHLNILWSLEPFRSYRNYFNVYAVESVSQDSGLTCDPGLLEEQGMDPAMRQKLQRRDTIFGLNFGGGCTNVNARGVTPLGTLNARVREYAAKATPNPDQILIIGNSRTYGGIGGGLATSTGSNALSPLITPHEIGHSLGRLTDEYTYSQRGVAGGTYRGGEPNNVHTTLLTEEDMKTQQKKWWRWLGEPSEAGGVIGRFEGGSGNTKGIWRPSKHSMMISLGYFYDQVSREQMVKQISERTGMIGKSTPTGTPVKRSSVLWVEVAHPVYHAVDITWKVGDREIASARNQPLLDLAKIGLGAGEQTITVTVVDPTDFVRDPAIRDRSLTATKTWTVSADAAATPDASRLAILRDRGLAGDPANPTRGLFTPKIGVATQTTRPVGGTDVVYIELTHPDAGSADPMIALPSITWTLDGRALAGANGAMSLPLAARRLTPGTHRLEAAVGLAGGRQAPDTRTWSVDNTMPTVAYTLSKPIATIPATADGELHVFMRDEFTMKLDPKDDQPGYIVAEFRLDGDGWHHYYGWPDAPPGTPFKFTARGTNIKELIYGSLSSEGLSPQPWEPREPGWGAHRIEYRAKDAAGNIGGVSAFRVTVEPAVACTATVTGTRAGALKIDSGVACLDNATITGDVTVAAGASLVATHSSISGAIAATGAATIELVATSVGGKLTV
ncbi:MAG TPA: M64 family metallopeptidase, partial [Vicinamibacterales bacterium]|nr:M64 family metallopeptidase [Vicinamibacterales bacterium]